jgi:SAM-dependent methyltransferase
MEKNNLRKMLELGCGQGRDTLFFASKGIEITALD